MTPIQLSRFDHMPLVGAVMTPFPHFVGPEDTVEAVGELMRRFDIHHVPVQEGSEVVGVFLKATPFAERHGHGCA